jgi:hypothetical protein
MRLVSILAVCASVGACNGVPGGPTPINDTAAYALAHVNEVCVAFPGMPGGTGVYGPAKLYPVNGPMPQGGIVVSISYCNPAE